MHALMDETLRALTEQVEAFCQKMIAPRAAEIDQSNAFPRDLWPQMGELGLHGITVAEEYDGVGLGYLAHVLVMEQVSRASASVGLSYGAHSNLCINQIHRHGTPDQKARYLPDLVSGKHVGALAMSEPGAGSDLTAVRTRARRDPVSGEWIVDGQKVWTSWAHESDWIFVLARCEPDSTRHKGLVLLLMMSLWSQLNQKPTVVIKPPVLTGEIRIEDGLPNKEWQESWALYLAHMIGNINPRNVEFVSKQVVAMLSTNLQLEKERDIRRIVDMMRMSNLTQSFEVQDLKYEASTRMVWVWGYKTTQLASSNKQATSATEDSADRRRWTFEFIIRLNELGMPVVTHIDQYDGLPRFDRANGVTEEGMVIEPPKKSSSKVQQAKPTKEQH